MCFKKLLTEDEEKGKKGPLLLVGRVKNVIYLKAQTSTLTPFVKPRDIFNLAVQNIFYIQSYVYFAFMYNLGSTKIIVSL